MAGRQSKTETKKVETVLLRIKRYGDSGWATCGIGVRPPERLVGDPRMKRLCPKLVPGQVIELPTTHPLVKQRKMVEVVDEPEFDEFIRPWVFRSDQDAAMANPSKSRLGPEQILTGLALSSGAAESQLRKLETRKAAQKDAGYDPTASFEDDGDFYEDYEGGPEPDYAIGYDDDPEELETEEQVAERASNKVLREEKDQAERVVDDEDMPQAAEEAPARRTGRTGRNSGSSARVSRGRGRS